MNVILREIKAASPGVRVLALSAHDTDAARAAMSAAGADGYVVKGAAPGVIARALRGEEPGQANGGH